MVAEPDPRILDSAASQTQEGANSVWFCCLVWPNGAMLKTCSPGYLANVGLQPLVVQCCRPACLDLHQARVCNLRCAVLQGLLPGFATRSTCLALAPKVWQPRTKCQQPHQNPQWLFSPQPFLQCQMYPNKKTTTPSTCSLCNSLLQE